MYYPGMVTAVIARPQVGLFMIQIPD
jgi:hypothetical protein